MHRWSAGIFPGYTDVALGLNRLAENVRTWERVSGLRAFFVNRKKGGAYETMF